MRAACKVKSNGSSTTTSAMGKHKENEARSSLTHYASVQNHKKEQAASVLEVRLNDRPPKSSSIKL